MKQRRQSIDAFQPANHWWSGGAVAAGPQDRSDRPIPGVVSSSSCCRYVHYSRRRHHCPAARCPVTRCLPGQEAAPVALVTPQSTPPAQAKLERRSCRLPPPMHRPPSLPSPHSDLDRDVCCVVWSPRPHLRQNLQLAHTVCRLSPSQSPPHRINPSSVTGRRMWSHR